MGLCFLDARNVLNLARDVIGRSLGLRDRSRGAHACACLRAAALPGDAGSHDSASPQALHLQVCGQEAFRSRSPGSRGILPSHCRALVSQRLRTMSARGAELDTTVI